MQKDKQTEMHVENTAKVIINESHFKSALLDLERLKTVLLCAVQNGTKDHIKPTIDQDVSL